MLENELAERLARRCTYCRRIDVFHAVPKRKMVLFPETGKTDFCISRYKSDILPNPPFYKTTVYKHDLGLGPGHEVGGSILSRLCLP